MKVRGPKRAPLNKRIRGMSRLPDRELKRILGRAVTRTKAEPRIKAHRELATIERQRSGKVESKRERRTGYRFEKVLTYGSAMGSAKDGEQWFETTWETIKRRVCKNWKLCERTRRYETEASFVAAIIGFLMKLRGFTNDDEIGIAFAIMLWRKGPEFLCECDDAP